MHEPTDEDEEGTRGERDASRNDGLGDLACLRVSGGNQGVCVCLST